MSDIAFLLDAVRAGDPEAPAQLLPLVYEELRQFPARKFAHERPGHASADRSRVHEAYLRLLAGTPMPLQRAFAAGTLDQDAAHRLFSS